MNFLPSELSMDPSETIATALPLKVNVSALCGFSFNSVQI